MDYLLLVAALHLFVCPFTKFEEYFNVQAMHDILYHGRNLSQYHHHDSTGDIPQTFIGAIIISVLVSPLNYVIENCGLPGITKFTAQIIVRAGIGACVIWAYILLKNAVGDHFGKQVANWFIVISCSQFHFMFYCTRPLSNMMVMPFVLLALRYWLLGNHRKMIWLFAASVMMFKTELISLFVMIMVLEVIQRRISCKKALQISLQAGLGSLIVTVLIDSCMWRRPTWPAGEAFLMGLVDGHQSSTQPFLWYWYSAIPRALGFSTVFIPVGVYLERRMIPLLSVCSAFILLNSFLLHKETRFIIYAFPLFNVIASCGCNILWNGRQKSFIRQCLGTAAALHLGGNAIITIMLLSIACSNYPGGAAIQRLHNIIPSDNHVDVYIDNLALQSGVTRFTEINNKWKYNTSDSTNVDIWKFTHLMIEARSKYSKNLRPFFKSHDVIDSIEGFSHLHINYQYFPPFKIKKKPIFTILQRKDLLGVRSEQDIDEILDLLPEEESERVDDEEVEEFQLESKRTEMSNQTQNTTEIESARKEKTTAKRSFDTLNISKELNASGENDTEKSGIESLKSLVNTNKAKQMSQSEPHRAMDQLSDGMESNKSKQQQDPSQSPDSTEVDEDFLGESDEIPPVPIGLTTKSNSRINKSAMKIIRSKTNNLAFDALQDALREEEELNKAPTPGTPENQLVMMMPLVSGRRKFIMPNVDVSATKKQAGESELLEDSTTGTNEVVSSGSPTEGSTQTVIVGSPENAVSHPNTKDANKPEKPFTVNAHTNELVQYNPKSIQLTVLNHEANTNQPTTAVELPGPNSSPTQTGIMNKPHIEVRNPTRDKIEQSQELSAENAVQIYGTKDTQRELTTEIKLNHDSNSENRSKSPKSFIFIWFPEEMKALKQQERDVALHIEMSENISSDPITGQTAAPSEEAILVKDSLRYVTGKNTKRISSPISKTVIGQKKEPKNDKTPMSNPPDTTVQ